MTTPDQLEREIRQVIEKAHQRVNESEGGFVVDYELAAKASANLCRQKMREVAEKAWEGGYNRCCWEEGIFKYKNNYPIKKEWLKENNLLNDNE